MNTNAYNEKAIQVVIARTFGKGNICIPNLTLSNVTDKQGSYCNFYEADLVMITPSLYLTEVEIKVSIQDFRNDFLKKHYHSCMYTRRLYYAVPESLYLECRHEIDFALSGAKAGLMTIRNNAGRLSALIEKGAPVFNSTAKKLPDELKYRYMTICCLKWYNREYSQLASVE